VTLEFPGDDAPVSWHLTLQEINNIQAAWGNKMGARRKQVQQFLTGENHLDCGCLRCRHKS
jgi:hypothetical protein